MRNAVLRSRSVHALCSRGLRVQPARGGGDAAGAAAPWLRRDGLVLAPRFALLASCAFVLRCCSGLLLHGGALC
jgi:hypothetical protein